MAKRKTKTAQISTELMADPRVRDRGVANRIRLMVEHEACHQAWGCALYQLHRLGWITTEQREAGDEYQRVVERHAGQQQIDPDVPPYDEDDLCLPRIKKAKSRWHGCVEVLGLGRSIIDEVVLDNRYPSTESEKKTVKDGLQLLANFFRIGQNKRNTR